MYLYSSLVSYSPLNLPVTTLFFWAISGCQLWFEHKRRVGMDSTDMEKYDTGARLCTFMVTYCHIHLSTCS